MPAKTSVLISYSRQDNRPNNYHVRLRDYFQKNLGIDVWIDLDVPGGSPWAAVIDEELKKATHLILIWTPHAGVSEYVTYEWAVALLRGIPIIPIQSPEFGAIKPSEVPALLADLNFINDPIEQSEEQAKLLKRILEDTRVQSYDDLASPAGLIQELRDGNWQKAAENLHTWWLGCTNIKLLRHVVWLLENTVPPNADEAQKKSILAAAKKLLQHIQTVELRVSHESELKLKVFLRQIAKDLQGKVPGEIIQNMVKGYVEAWSLAQFGTPKPPPPDLHPRDYFSPRKRSCGLCRLKVTTDNKGCCDECGLFYTWWEEIDEESN